MTVEQEKPVFKRCGFMVASQAPSANMMLTFDGAWVEANLWQVGFPIAGG